MYSLRIGGTNEYVSNIDRTDSRCWPPGSVSLVLGKQHPNTKWFPTRMAAEKAAEVVLQIEGFTCSVEPDASSMMEEDLATPSSGWKYDPNNEETWEESDYLD